MKRSAIREQRASFTIVPGFHFVSSGLQLTAGSRANAPRRGLRFFFFRPRYRGAGRKALGKPRIRNPK
jgi:hypothetical protein